MLKLFKFLNRHQSSIENTTLDLELGGSKVRPVAEKSDSPRLKAFKTKMLLISPVLISVVLSIFGQTILKRGMSDLGPLSFSERGIFEIIWSIATNPFVVVGMAIFVASVLFWLIGLSRVALSYAYPLISLSYVAILATSYFMSVRVGQGYHNYTRADNQNANHPEQAY